MCLAIPVQVVELRPNDMAICDVGGIRKEISMALVDDVAVGDWVIAHVGYAINKLDPEEADCFALLGSIRFDQGQWEEALAEVERGLSWRSSGEARITRRAISR